MPHDVRYADCTPNMITQDFDLARAYYAANYTPRSSWFKWQKGPFSPPFLLSSPSSGASVNYSIYFNEFNGGVCPTIDCHLQCTSQTIDLVTGGVTGSSVTFCINGEKPIYNFDVSFDTEGDRLSLPASFNFVFEDSLGNQVIQEVQSLSGIQPMNPMVGVVTDSSGKSKAHIGVVMRTIGFNEISEDSLTQFIIERCDWPSRTNIRTFKGPLNVSGSNNLYTDTTVTNGQEVAYRVRFENTWGEESLNSDWIVGG